MADDQEVLGVGALLEELLESLRVAAGARRVGEEDVGLVAGLGADEGGGLEAALEGAGDDQVELNVERVEDVGELEAVALAFFVEGTFGVEERVGAACAGAGVAKNEEIHRLRSSLR